MTKLAVRSDLPVEAPPVALEDLDHLSHLHDLRLGVSCDGLFQPATPVRPELSGPLQATMPSDAQGGGQIDYPQ